jgi:hypothetical protein
MDIPNFKNIFQKTTLTIHLSDKIEIGFNQSGPNLAIAGSLTTSSKIVYIDDMALDIISKEDKSYRQFDWEQFRPHKFTVGNTQGFDLKMASKFFITPKTPFQYNIFFSDQQAYRNISPLLKKIRDSWQAKWNRNSQVANPTPTKVLFENFINDKFIMDIWEETKQFSLWRKGEYNLTIVVRTKNPNQNFELQKSFTITQENVEHLKKNSIQILAELCNQSRIQNVSFSTNLT